MKLALNKSKSISQSVKLRVFLVSIGFFALASLWMVFGRVEPTVNIDTSLGSHKFNVLSSDSSISTTDELLKIPKPVFVTSLPKSGTTSTWKYFLCGLGKGQASHQYGKVENINGTKQVRLGKCFKRNMQANRPLLEGCGDYQVWTDVGVLAPGVCYYPSIHGGLQALYEGYPHATILQVVRETESWVNSTMEFNDLWTRWSTKCDQFPPMGSQRSDYAKFYDWHTDMVRQFAKDHPSMTYIEVTLEGTETGRILEEQTGINASCWVNSRTKKGRRAKPNWKKRKDLKKNRED